MFNILFILIIIIMILLWRKAHWKEMYYKSENRVKEILKKKIFIQIEEEDINKSLEERFCFVSAAKIFIHNTDEYFYETLEKKKEFYEEIIYKSQEFKKMLQNGMTIDEIKRTEGCLKSACVCFDLSTAIMGEERDGVIYLSNGRHRCAIAKEHDLEVPIYITGRYITKVVEDCI